MKSLIKKHLNESLVNLYEAKKVKIDAGDEIHLPELTMDKEGLIKFLKETYNIEVKK